MYILNYLLLPFDPDDLLRLPEEDLVALFLLLTRELLPFFACEVLLDDLPGPLDAFVLPDDRVALPFAGAEDLEDDRDDEEELLPWAALLLSDPYLPFPPEFVFAFDPLLLLAGVPLFEDVPFPFEDALDVVCPVLNLRPLLSGSSANSASTFNFPTANSVKRSSA